MKIELIKETKQNGVIYYYTNVDGKYLEGSLKLDLEAAIAIYEQTKNGLIEPKIEVLAQCDIDANTQTNGHSDNQPSETLA